jgi:uncharacterized protein YerC
MFKKFRKNDYNWTFEYIKEYNQMRAYYERMLLEKQELIDTLHKEIEVLKNKKSAGRQKQISDADVETIRYLKNKGLSYNQIAKQTGWSKATISRVINNKYE